MEIINPFDSGKVLLVLEKDGNAVVLEFGDMPTLEAMKQKAEKCSVTCRIVNMEEYLARYRLHRYFDLRSPSSRETFDLDNQLKTWEAGNRLCKDDDGEVPPWVIH
jgi:hypothetical protein